MLFARLKERIFFNCETLSFNSRIGAHGRSFSLVNNAICIIIIGTKTYFQLDAARGYRVIVLRFNVTVKNF